MPRSALEATWERYWRESLERIEGRRAWDAYTPYEWRSVSAFVRLGQPQRAQALADFFMRDRRPAAWNQWGEVVVREAREVRFLGDMPHAWISSDFIRATLDRLAYERDSDRALVLAAGVPRDWLASGVVVRRLPTRHGALSYRLQRDGSDGALDGRGRPGLARGRTVVHVARRRRAAAGERSTAMTRAGAAARCASRRCPRRCGSSCADLAAPGSRAPSLVDARAAGPRMRVRARQSGLGIEHAMLLL